MRAVIDTNVLVSAQFWHGAPHHLFVHVRGGNVTPILSPAFVAEFACYRATQSATAAAV